MPELDVNDSATLPRGVTPRRMHLYDEIEAVDKAQSIELKYLGKRSLALAKITRHLWNRLEDPEDDFETSGYIGGRIMYWKVRFQYEDVEKGSGLLYASPLNIRDGWREMTDLVEQAGFHPDDQIRQMRDIVARVDEAYERALECERWLIPNAGRNMTSLSFFAQEIHEERAQKQKATEAA